MESFGDDGPGILQKKFDWGDERRDMSPSLLKGINFDGLWKSEAHGALVNIFGSDARKRLTRFTHDAYHIRGDTRSWRSSEVYRVGFILSEESEQLRREYRSVFLTSILPKRDFYLTPVAWDFTSETTGRVELAVLMAE